jgi:hypothetical protein
LAAVVVVLFVLALGAVPIANATDRPEGPVQLTATLDGESIKPADVGGYYCDDFAYPVITCFTDPKLLEFRVASLLSLTALTYVVIYDYTGWAGSYMYVSQDYTVLAFVGWNDRVSSLRSVNYEDGQFFTDWFYGGTAWYFCCNAQYASLGGYDNSFSSVHRT